jgi:hypothetical protein
LVLLADVVNIAFQLALLHVRLTRRRNHPQLAKLCNTSFPCNGEKSLGNLPC